MGCMFQGWRDAAASIAIVVLMEWPGVLHPLRVRVQGVGQWVSGPGIFPAVDGGPFEDRPRSVAAALA